MFTDALSYPRQGSDATKTILVGTLLTLLGFLLVPLVVTTGYMVRVVRGVFADDQAPPVFEDWRGLMVDGAKALAVTLLYFVPAALVLAATGIAMALFGDGTTVGGYLAGTVGLLGLLLAGVVGLACYYVAGAAFVAVARTGRVSAGLDRRALVPVLASGRYANAWALSVVVLVLSGLVVSVLGVLPLVLDAPLSALVGFYAAVSVAYLLARGVDAATTVETTPGERPARTTA